MLPLAALRLRSLRRNLTAARLRGFSVRAVLEHYLEPRDAEIPEGFHFFPEFLNDAEQRILLASALRELDGNGSPGARRNMKRSFKGKDVYNLNTSTVQDLFLPEESGCYDFEEGHYDGVIQHYREMQVGSWPPNPALKSILDRLRTLLPASIAQEAILTHLLHLSSKGEILPHIDNVDASGSWIAGVSLGHERILRMEGPTTFQVLLPSGSAYVQKGAVRYSYRHSILRAATFKDRHIAPGQRISVMLRDRIRPGLTKEAPMTSMSSAQ